MYLIPTQALSPPNPRASISTQPACQVKLIVYFSKEFPIYLLTCDWNTIDFCNYLFLYDNLVEYSLITCFQQIHNIA